MHACEYNCANGTLGWTNWGEDNHDFVNWDGMEECNTGGVIGMLLNLDEGTLSVYKNNRRLGVMKDGLSGPYCWCCCVWEGHAVSIKRGQAPRAGDGMTT